jgi:enoyl-CoA hydratase
MSVAVVENDEVQNNEVMIRADRALRRLTLNRPKALNALTLGMATIMTEHLKAWASDPAVGAVMIDGAGERALCAGGDLRGLYDAAKAGTRFPEQFWADEYRLDLLIARYPKPIVAVMDGVVMGGGVGIAAHASHRVVTERSSVAMPEVAIGFFPDVGVSYLLARSPGFVGTYLALTGERMNATDAIHAGLADIAIPAAKIPELPGALASCRSADEVTARLSEISVPPAPGKLAAARGWIDACFAGATVEEIVARLEQQPAEEARDALATMRTKSPTALKVTLRNIREATSFGKLEQSFQQDYRIALACIAGHDFIEGIRATIVDKDRNPRWRPDTLAGVTADIVEHHFRPLGELELIF